MIVVDASVWVSRFLPEDAFHQAGRAWLLEMTTAGVALIAPTTALAEVSGSIARRTGSEQLGYQVVQQIRRLPTVQFVAVDDALGLLAAQTIKGAYGDRRAQRYAHGASAATADQVTDYGRD